MDLLEINIETNLGQIDVLPLAEAASEYASRALGPNSPLAETAAREYAEVMLGRKSKLQQGTEFVRAMLARSSEDAMTPERLALLKLANSSENELGNYAEALVYARRVLQLTERLYGKEHVTYVGAESRLARALRRVGRFDEARDLYSSSVERALRVSGPSSLLYAIAAHNAGDAALHEPRDPERALAMSGIAVVVGPRAMPADSRQMGFLWATRSAALLINNDPLGALKAAIQSSEIFQRNLAQSIPLHAEVELFAAIAESRLGRIDAARARVAALGTAVSQIYPDSLAPELARDQHILPGVSP